MPGSATPLKIELARKLPLAHDGRPRFGESGPRLVFETLRHRLRVPSAREVEGPWEALVNAYADNTCETSNPDGLCES